jgi:hypothetical protein
MPAHPLSLREVSGRLAPIASASRTVRFRLRPEVWAAPFTLVVALGAP